MVEAEQQASALSDNRDDDDRIVKSISRYRTCAMLACVLAVLSALAGIVVGVIVVGSGMGVDDIVPVTIAPTSIAPTSYLESFGIRAQVERAVGRDVLSNPESPYVKALDWITFKDPQQLTPEDPNLIQRYTAAYLYFATTVDGPWRSCNPPEDPWNDPAQCIQDRLEDGRPLLLDVYTSYPSSSWLSTANECDWAGIKCDELDQVTELNLRKFHHLLRSVHINLQ